MKLITADIVINSIQIHSDNVNAYRDCKAKDLS